MENQVNTPDSTGQQTQFGQENLPGSVATLILGIISIAMSCSGVVGLILGIIALSMSSKDKKLLLADPGKYNEKSVKNMKAGRICGIVGLCVSAAAILFWIIYIVFIIIMVGGAF